MIKIENYVEIENAINSSIELLKKQITSNRPISKMNLDECKWFEELDNVRQKLEWLREEMIFTLETTD